MNSNTVHTITVEDVKTQVFEHVLASQVDAYEGINKRLLFKFNCRNNEFEYLVCVKTAEGKIDVVLDTAMLDVAVDKYNSISGRK